MVYQDTCNEHVLGECPRSLGLFIPSHYGQSTKYVSRANPIHLVTFT